MSMKHHALNQPVCLAAAALLFAGHLMPAWGQGRGRGAQTRPATAPAAQAAPARTTGRPTTITPSDRFQSTMRFDPRVRDAGRAVPDAVWRARYFGYYSGWPTD